MLILVMSIPDGKPFLFIFQVNGPDGKPVTNAEFDWWQADAKGGYYFATHRLRGKFRTDENGCAELLTITPYGYGVPGTDGFRPGHGHTIVSPPPERSHDLNRFTTQLYIIDGNKTDALRQDPYVSFMFHWQALYLYLLSYGF